MIISTAISKFLTINELNSEKFTSQVWLAVQLFWISYAVNPQNFSKQYPYFENKVLKIKNNHLINVKFIIYVSLKQNMQEFYCQRDWYWYSLN